MTETGIIIKIDDMGRLVIPREIRRMLKVREYDQFEVYYGNDSVTFRKCSALSEGTPTKGITGDDEILRRIKFGEDISSKEIKKKHITLKLFTMDVVIRIAIAQNYLYRLEEYKSLNL